MQKLVAILLVVVLAGSVTIPNVFSDGGQNNNNHENDNHNDDSKNNVNTNEHDKHENEIDDKVHFGFSNATNIAITLPNGTKVTFGFSNGTNVGQQISSFVHLIRDVFKHDQNNAKQIIKDCREKARNANPADKKKIMNECKATLKELKQKLSLEHKQLQVDLEILKEMIIGDNQQLHKQDLAEMTSGQPAHKTNSQDVSVGSNRQIHQNFHAKTDENQNKTFEKAHGHTQHGNQNDKSHEHNQED